MVLIGGSIVPRLYSRQDIRKTYELIQEHMRAKAIIREHALNRRDIREVALEGLDLSAVRRVLDLGCGYGFFTEKLQGRLHQGAHILGIDLVDRENRRVFLQTVKDIGYEGEFVRSRADIIRSMDESSFDMAIASYSLYFFPHLVGAIARVLSPEGVFIAVTHSKYSLREVTSFVPRCMERMGIVPPIVIAIPGGAAHAQRLAERLDGEFADVLVRQFPDGEVYVRIDSPVVDREVVLVGGLDQPGGKLLPLLFPAAIARDLGATRVGLVAPYLTFMRQDARYHPGEGVTAAYFAALMSRTVASQPASVRRSAMRWATSVVWPSPVW